MKRTAILLILSVFLFSCKKEKTSTLVGSWVEEANYTAQSSGAYTWEPASRFPFHISFTGEGQYSSYNDVPAGYGRYQYNPATSDLQLMPAGTQQVYINKVSLLNETYVILDYYSNGVMEKRTKFRKE
ncbi:MAG: hypothetical protein HZA79_06345 [Sphingobacteriales bacterium]|nr:hypothetical protein [Sphingobacteriales bacterium]